jgi:hypothetical protein
VKLDSRQPGVDASGKWLAVATCRSSEKHVCGVWKNVLSGPGTEFILVTTPLSGCRADGLASRSKGVGSLTGETDPSASRKNFSTKSGSGVRHGQKRMLSESP